MANRVLLGQASTARGGSSKFGLWISKPGENVLTTGEDNLIFNTDKGSSGDIKALYQLLTVSANAATVSTTIAANTTVNVSITTVSAAHGLIAFGGYTTSLTDSGAKLEINSINATTINVKNANTTNSQTYVFSAVPQYKNVARF